MARCLGSNHGYVDIGRRHDGPEVDGEPVCEHQRLARLEPRLDLRFIQVGLQMIRNQDHDDVGGLGGLRDGHHFQPRGLRFGPALAAFVEPDNDIATGIAQIQRMRVPLAAVADNGDRLVFDCIEACRLFRSIVLP